MRKGRCRRCPRKWPTGINMHSERVTHARSHSPHNLATIQNYHRSFEAALRQHEKLRLRYMGARLTGRKLEGESPLDRRHSQVTILREPCIAVGEGRGEASVAARVGSAIERQKDRTRVPSRCVTSKPTRDMPSWRGMVRLRGVEEHRHARLSPGSGRPPCAILRGRMQGRSGKARVARAGDAWAEELDGVMVCAGQRPDQLGRSPTGALE